MRRTDTRVAQVGDFKAVVLENAHLRAVIVPELGGRVWELEDRVRARQWIWHRPGVPLTAVKTGAAYDDVWAGGWEELFPNDAPGRFEGRDLPDHGEWWTLAWTADASPAGSASVRLSADSRVVRASCTKEFHLEPDSPTFSVSYRIRSEESEPFHFLFKQHLPIALTPGCRLRLPGGDVHQVDPSFGTMLDGGGPWAWPMAAGPGGSVADLQVVPEPSPALREFVYVRDLPEPWCGVDDSGRRASLRMSFDHRAFPFVWFFLAYGGWRNTYTAVLEPCTNMPKDLGEAVRLRQSACLRPGEEFETTVSVTLGGLAAAER